MTPKVDWDVMKNEFITGDWLTLIKFAKAKGLKYDTVKRHSKHWLKEKSLHVNRVSSEIRDADVRGKVLDAEKKAEYMSGVMAGMLNQWQDMNAEYREIKTSLSDKSFVANRAGRARVMQVMRALEKGLAEINKSLELLAGRPTSREASVEEEQKTDDLMTRFDRLGGAN